MKKTEQTVGQRLAAAREKLDLTQEELAKRSRVPRNTIQNIEYDKVSPRLENLVALATALDVSLDDLAGPPNPLRTDPNWQELARLVQHYSDASRDRRLLALYILSNSEQYLTEYESIPDAAPLSKVIKKVL